MSDFPGFELTEAGKLLRAKCEAGAVLTYSAARIGSGALPPGENAFSALADNGVITVYNSEKGAATNAQNGNTSFTIETTIPGDPVTEQVATIAPESGAEIAGGDYFVIHSPLLDFHIWYKVDGVGVAPVVAGSIPVKVEISSLDSLFVVADKTATAIDQDKTGAGDLVRLVNFELEAGITGVENLGNATTKLPIQFNNEALETAFMWREIGIYAMDPDAGEILYCVTNAGNDADPIPAEGGATIIDYNIDAITEVGSCADVSAIPAASSAYASYSHTLDKKAHGNIWEIKNAAYTAVAGDQLHVDTSAGSVEVTMPENPIKDDCIWFNDFAKTWDVNGLAIEQAASGELLQGLTGLDGVTKGLCFGLVFTDDETKGWVII